MNIYKPEIKTQTTRHEIKDAGQADLIVFEFHDRASVSIQLGKVKNFYGRNEDRDATLTPFVVLTEEKLLDLLSMVQRNKPKDARGNS